MEGRDIFVETAIRQTGGRGFQKRGGGNGNFLAEEAGKQRRKKKLSDSSLVNFLCLNSAANLAANQSFSSRF